MNKLKDFLVEEVRKPIRALKMTVLLGVKCAWLSFLRFVLWTTFYLLPIACFLLAGVRLVRHQVEREFASKTSPVMTSAPPKSVSILPSLGIRGLSEEFLYWLRQLKRFKGA